jgi:hypothetical protein
MHPLDENGKSLSFVLSCGYLVLSSSCLVVVLSCGCLDWGERGSEIRIWVLKRKKKKNRNRNPETQKFLFPQNFFFLLQNEFWSLWILFAVPSSSSSSSPLLMLIIPGDFTPLVLGLHDLLLKSRFSLQFKQSNHQELHPITTLQSYKGTAR